VDSCSVSLNVEIACIKPLRNISQGTAIEGKSQMTTSSYTSHNFFNLISFRSCSVGEHRRPIRLPSLI
jgi:hypothetical protein